MEFEFAVGSILASVFLFLFSTSLLLRLRQSPDCWSGFRRPERDEFWHGLLLLFALAGLVTIIVSTAVILAAHHSAGTTDPFSAGYSLLAIYILEVAQFPLYFRALVYQTLRPIGPVVLFLATTLATILGGSFKPDWSVLMTVPTGANITIAGLAWWHLIKRQFDRSTQPCIRLLATSSTVATVISVSMLIFALVPFEETELRHRIVYWSMLVAGRLFSSPLFKFLMPEKSLRSDGSFGHESAVELVPPPSGSTGSRFSEDMDAAYVIARLKKILGSHFGEIVGSSTGSP